MKTFRVWYGKKGENKQYSELIQAHSQKEAEEKFHATNEELYRELKPITHKTYTMTIQFTASDPLEAMQAASLMRETFCNQTEIKEVAASLIDQNFTQWLMVRDGVEQECNPIERKR